MVRARDIFWKTVAYLPSDIPSKSKRQRDQDGAGEFLHSACTAPAVGFHRQPETWRDAGTPRKPPMSLVSDPALIEIICIRLIAALPLCIGRSPAHPRRDTLFFRSVGVPFMHQALSDFP
jgi:hypothetical protein